MNLEVKDIPAKLAPIIEGLKRYVAVIFVMVVCGVYGFLAYRINALTQSEPSPEAVSEKLQTVTRPRVDQQSIDKMLQLEEENIEVKALFDDARNNPFKE